MIAEYEVPTVCLILASISKTSKYQLAGPGLDASTPHLRTQCSLESQARARAGKGETQGRRENSLQDLFLEGRGYSDLCACYRRIMRMHKNEICSFPIPWRYIYPHNNYVTSPITIGFISTLASTSSESELRPELTNKSSLSSCIELCSNSHSGTSDSHSNLESESSFLPIHCTYGGMAYCTCITLITRIPYIIAFSQPASLEHNYQLNEMTYQTYSNYKYIPSYTVSPADTYTLIHNTGPQKPTG